MRLLTCTCILLLAATACADTIMTHDGKELKGIVVEEYRDRLTFSTADGEITVMKADVKELYYDTEEDNLIKLAEQAQDRGDFITAYVYYSNAVKVNPQSKRANDGLTFLRGYLFRKEEAKKEEVVRRQAEFERFGSNIAEIKTEEIEAREIAARVRKTLGITLALKGSVPYVETIARNSAADDAGIWKNDLLVAIWGKLTGYLSLKDVMKTLADRPSLEIKCIIERQLALPLPDNRGAVSSAGDMAGAALSMEFDGLTAMKVAEGSIAWNAGLRAGDLIVAIDGQSTRYMPIENAVKLIRTHKGGSIAITIRRELTMWRRDRP